MEEDGSGKARFDLVSWSERIFRPLRGLEEGKRGLRIVGEVEEDPEGRVGRARLR